MGLVFGNFPTHTLLTRIGCVCAVQYIRIIQAYMGFAGFSIFFVLAGIILIELLQSFHVHLDFISFTYILWNFAVSHVCMRRSECARGLSLHIRS